jgi:outer membrane protein assembly factor BamA
MTASALAGGAQLAAQPAEVISEIQVRGNVVTPDEELLRLAGVAIGMPMASDTVSVVAERLRATKRFERVDVLKRYASISDPTRIALVLIVDEGPVTIQATGDPDRPTRVVRRRRLNLLFLPVLDGEDEKRFDHGLLTRIDGGASVSRKTNPFFQEDDDRAGVWAHGERQVLRSLRFGATVGWQHVSFQRTTDQVVDAGAEAVLDTRLDPWLARNAVYARAAQHRLAFGNQAATDRTDLETRVYLGLIGQTILVASAQRSAADGPLPNYLKALLGGQESLRGLRAGTAVGDTLVAGSLEVRVPLTSPLRLGKVGVSGFTDAGTAYDHGGRFEDQAVKRGFGASVWCAAAFLRVNVAVAHGIGSSTRVHASGNLTF